MLALLLLPVLVAGFIYCHVHPVYRVKLHRFEGQYLYLRCAQFGTKCLALAILIAYFANQFLPDDGVTLFGNPYSQKISVKLSAVATYIGVKDDGDAKKMAWFLIITCLTFLSVYIFKWFAHLRLYIKYGNSDPSMVLTGLLLEDSPLDDLLFKIFLKTDQAAMLTMDDRKVYVGRIVSLGEPSETAGMDRDIKIIPIMSGYRNKDTLDVNFTTQYSDGNSGIELCLRQDLIVSATIFDFNADAKWKQKRVDSENWLRKLIIGKRK